MFVDIHTHILPSADDGAKDMDTAIQMLKIAYANGTEHIIATPHYFPGESQYHPSQIIERCDELGRIAAREGIRCIVYPGCEVFISPNLPEQYARNEIVTLNLSSYMLIELPMLSIPPYTDSILYELQLKGIKPIIAHPERNQEIIEEPDILSDMVKRGILTQINAGSITGLYGKKVQKTAFKLIKQGLVHFIASDAHTTRKRSPNLSRAAEVLRKKKGRINPEKMLCTNGLCVIKNKRVEGDENS